MIYLIRSKNESLSLLKIGYTRDSKKSSRYTSYRLHNPLFEVLYEIPGGTEEYEKLLQLYFGEFQYEGYGNEWFYEHQEIINYFETHKTVESLQDLKEKGLAIDLKSQRVFRKRIELVINRVINLKVNSGDITLEAGSRQVESMVDNIFYNHRIRSEDRLWNFIESTFGYSKIDIFPDLDNKVMEFLAKFDSYTRFTDKMKFLCDNVNNFTEEEFSSILGSINITFKNYYNTLGKDRIRALQYKNSVLESEYLRLYSNQSKFSSLKDAIYSNFYINTRYTKSFIKSKLIDLYSELGIQSSPKATDLETYFEVKDVHIINKETGKKDRGYLILKKKNL